MSDVQMDKLEQADFTLADVTRMTSLKGETIRAWRKRGHLPALPRYAKTELREVASLAVTKLLMDHGMPLGEARQFGEHFAPDVVYLAVLSTRGSVEVHGTERGIATFEDQWGNGDELARELAELNRSPAVVITSADGGALKTDLKLEDDPDSQSGYYVNLEGVGRHLGANAHKPLFTVRIARKEDDDGPVLVRRVPKMSLDRRVR
ncbi:MAG: hypothetical protein EON87_03635 [Brevundimonas sp.]|nr:MAG: hypothetical protein EON87_03635 [Brevundimonas sp.]